MINKNLRQDSVWLRNFYFIETIKDRKKTKQCTLLIIDNTGRQVNKYFFITILDLIWKILLE